MSRRGEEAVSKAAAASERGAVYVAVSDCRECDAIDETQLAKRRMKVSTNTDLIKIYASETVACKKLRGLHKSTTNGNTMTERVVFHDIFGQRFTWKKQSIDFKAAHFARFPGSDRVHRDSPAVSDAHEQAILCASRLIMQNRLKVVQICNHLSHVSIAADITAPWADGMTRCVAAFSVDGCGEGITTATSYRWYPDQLSGDEYFVLDYAVIKHNKLHIAVEIQRSHANSKRKREAFRQHRICNVQIEANEIIEKCSRLEWDDTRDVVVKHHPVSADVTWRCLPCHANNIEEQRQKAEIAAREAERKRKRDEFEASMTTTYDEPERGKYVKGFISEFVYVKPGGTFGRFFLEEIKYDHRINPRPKCIKILTCVKDVLDCATKLKGHMVCVRLDNVSRDVWKPPPSKEGEEGKDAPPVRTYASPSKFITWVNSQSAVTTGPDIPGIILD